MNPSEWNAKHQNAESKTIANQQINLQLEIITVNIKKAHLQLQLLDGELGVAEIFAKYLGKSEKKNAENSGSWVGHRGITGAGVIG